MCSDPPGLRWAPPAKVSLNRIKAPRRLWTDCKRMKREHFVIERQAIFLEYQLLQLKIHMPASLHRRGKMLKNCHFFTNQHPELTNALDSPPPTPLPYSKPYEPDYNAVIQPLYSVPSSASPADPPSKPDVPFPTCANDHNLTDCAEHSWHSAFVGLSRDFQSVCLRLAQLELELALVELRLDIIHIDCRRNSRPFNEHQRALRTAVFEWMRVIYDAIARWARK